MASGRVPNIDMILKGFFIKLVKSLPGEAKR